MKNKILILITLIFGMLFITGCDIKYTLDINDDDTYTEKIKISFATELCYESNETNPASSCKVYLNNMKNSITSYYGLQNYIVTVDEKDDTTTATFEITYDTLSEFKNSNTYKLFFVEKNINEDTFKYSKVLLKPKYFETHNIISSEINKFSININSSKKLIDTNADIEDNGYGEYIWNLSNLEVDEVYFTLTDKKTNSNSFFNKIKTNEKNKQEQKVEKKYDSFLLVVVIALGVLLLMVIAILFIRRIKESKRL